MRYVLGFLFDERFNNVVLIHKLRPEWQRGKLNGVGGHIEEGETPHKAMHREFLEETGLDIPSWRRISTLTTSNNAYHMTVFGSVASQDILDQAVSKTEESVIQVPVDSLFSAPVIPNLYWLVPQTISVLDGREQISSFEIVEW